MSFLANTYLLKNDFLESDNIVPAIEDYIIWCSVNPKYRPVSNNLFKILNTCKFDASNLFGDLKCQLELIHSFQLDTAKNLDTIENTIKSFHKNSNVINNVCATVGLMATASEYWCNDTKPNDTTFKIIGMLNSIFDHFDFNLIKFAIISRLKTFKV
ncbi:hypothetical protein [Hypsugopox virus]|nr:hypothetical protein [Hypsugopox virus]